jgi:hypothetical protein
MALPALSGLASTISPMPASSWSAPSTSGCGYVAASLSFACPTVATNGLMLTQSFTLLDGSGTPQSAFGTTTTAAVRTNTRLTGTLSASGGSLAVDQSQVLTLSGLLAGPRLLNGTSIAHVVATRGSGTAIPFTSITTTTISDLALPASANGPSAWPTSGTIALDATTELATSGMATGAVTTHALITFNGTSKVVVTFSGTGGIDRCTIDLAGQAAPVCN